VWDRKIIKKITRFALKKGVIFISAGILNNVIRFLLPLVITEEQFNFRMDVLDEVIENCRR